MDLDAKPYRAFVKVAETGSFSRAAEALNVSQPALSAQIRELERRIGFPLFFRTSRHVEVTPQGNLFLSRARRMILETEWINQAAREIRTNELRIGAAHHTALIVERRTLVERFQRRHRDVPIRIIGRNHAQLFADLQRNDVDLAITIELATADSPPSAVEPAVSTDLDRWAIRSREVRLLIPAAQAPADRRLGLDTLAGMAIATVNRSHGIALSEGIARRLSEVGGVLVHPPEGDGVAIARHAALFDMPAIDLGWFDLMPEGLVSCDVVGLNLTTTMVVLAHREARRAGAERFIADLDKNSLTERPGSSTLSFEAVNPA